MRAGVVALSLVLVVPGIAHSVDAGGQGRRAGTQKPANNIRFADMDTNGDGVISRREWRGSNASFIVHDWDGDGTLSRDEVRMGGRRPAPPRREQPDDFDNFDREYVFTNWTVEGFTELDHNRDGRITADEWHYARGEFNRADYNRDGTLTRIEFLGGDEPDDDDDRDDTFWNLDHNNDGRITRDEWHGSRARFDARDLDRNGYLSRTEMGAATEAPPDLFSSLDVDKDGAIAVSEWHWSRGSFDQRDPNRDGRITRDELTRTGGGPTPTQTQAHRAGYDRGLADGRKAGLQDKTNRWGWDVERRPEMINADAGYEARLNARVEYQAGYRDGFRKGYREAFDAR